MCKDLGQEGILFLPGTVWLKASMVGTGEAGLGKVRRGLSLSVPASKFKRELSGQRKKYEQQKVRKWQKH